MFTITSWYTKNTEYENIMKESFMPSILRLNIPHKIYGVESLDNWRKNTNLKPSVIKKAFDELNTDLLVVDIDSIIHSYPKLLEEIPEEYDMAIFYLNWNEWYQNGSNRNELCSGTLYIRNREICKKLLNEWEYYGQHEGNNKPDQVVLEDVLKRFEPQIKIYKLPYEYCWINSLPNNRETYVQRPKNVIIEHFQVSRQLRRRIPLCQKKKLP